ncbi:response regulator transcription factor [Kriegella aquimaris]|uniref:Regulatory protein, luxR family n=1 Tax=Kriegella aquimaris TaxID=192904 RepID=A0A1G9NEU1_9FLAO|nr:helix-turn-helix transcriptional regulator [Kriegella aquimaris]SDL84821.1 regulatory protein, luxR family [Kriegella aquimaris]
MDGKDYFLNQLSNLKADLHSMNAQAIKKKFSLFPNQAVSIYDYNTFELKYVDGFQMFGMKNDEITMVDVFNTAVPEHREVCGELSGKILQFAKDRLIKKDSHVLNMTYAGLHKDGTRMHIMFQAKIFETTSDEIIKSACTMMTHLPHLKPPNIVSWSVHGPSFDHVYKLLDKSIVSPNHIRSREQEILQLMSGGLTMHEMADNLCISNRTVEKHLENLRHRFNCQNSIQLVAFAKDMELL